jgi:hypothetical protein
VKCGFLRRLARGVFVKEPHFQCALVYDLEILARKARAFAREMAPYLPENIGAQSGVSSISQPTAIAVDGRTTSLLIGDKRYDLKQVSKRRMALMQDESGRVLASFWKAGKANVTFTMVNEAIRKFSVDERQSLHQKIRYMPAWLSDLLIAASRRWQDRPQLIYAR